MPFYLPERHRTPPRRLPSLSNLLHSLLPSVLPSSCALCGASQEDVICMPCSEQYLAARRHRCHQCAIPLSDTAAHVCGECLRHPPAFDATIAATDYAPPVDQLVQSLKFRNQLQLAPMFSRRILHVAGTVLQDDVPELMVAVPLGPRRLVERGFNQALEIAKPLARASAIRLEATLVVRQRDTMAQSLLHPDERRRNMRGAFLLPGSAGEHVQGRHVAVVDDVMTTGETLHELAATLKRFGAARVTNLVFARTAPK